MAKTTPRDESFQPSLNTSTEASRNSREADSSVRISLLVLHSHPLRRIGLPTDTIYGLAADAGNGNAVNALYATKGRSTDVPLAVCVAEVQDVARLCEVHHLPDGLLDALLPGPVTAVLRRKETSPLAPELNPGLPSIGRF